MNNHNEHLGVNRIGRNIRKSPIHQTNFQPQHPNRQQQDRQNQQQQQSNSQNQQPQPQVYNINKNDFRNVVQQLTGTPSRDPSPNPPPPPPRSMATTSAPRPAANLLKHTSNRLQKIRPPPLTPIARPTIPNNHINHNPAPNSGPNPSYLPRPPPPAQAPSAFPRTPPSLWAGVTESPVSAYMRYLENSVLNPELSGQQAQFGPPIPQNQLPPHGQMGQSQTQLGPPHPAQPPYPGLLPTPPSRPGGFNSPRGAAPPLSPLGLLPSPSAFLNLLSPRSPYPSLPPRFQLPSPLAQSFFPSPLSQSGGILGHGTQPPPSPGRMFPPSPSWFVPSPRWRDM